jgi:hypothetical protein
MFITTARSVIASASVDRFIISTAFSLTNYPGSGSNTGAPASRQTDNTTFTTICDSFVFYGRWRLRWGIKAWSGLI